MRTARTRRLKRDPELAAGLIPLPEARERDAGGPLQQRALPIGCLKLGPGELESPTGVAHERQCLGDQPSPEVGVRVHVERAQRPRGPLEHR